MSPQEEPPVPLSEFGRSWQSFMQAMARAVPPLQIDDPLGERVRSHLGADPDGLPAVTEEFQLFDLVNVQVALDDMAASPEYEIRVIGLGTESRLNHFLSLTTIATRPKPGMPHQVFAEGPIEYSNVHLDEDRVLRCLQSAVLLITQGENRIAALLVGPRQQMGQFNIRLQLMCESAGALDRFIAELRSRMNRLNVYRGHVISLAGASVQGGLGATFRKLPRIAREQVVLPPRVLERLERQTFVFSEHAEQLRAQGRHLKRGLLLYGPPGTGKTLSIMHLATLMPGRTTILVTGQAMGLIPHSCALARSLEPSTLVIEDVDLVAQERTMPMGGGPLLFELLNEMDGLAEDADILFVLTSNRPEMLEPALAARPGRVDEAIELPLPDADCRLRLFALYSHGLKLTFDDFGPYVERTQGVPAAFIKEVMRRATLRAVIAGTDEISPREMDSALEDLLSGGRLVQRLLGMAAN